MDFHALPRRELQALCKRNGVRANMTNAAMADALRALPTVDGIEEYVKQPVAVPEAAAVAEEPQKLETQGCQRPRGRRATAKPSEPIKPNDGKEEEKEVAKRQSNNENAVVGRRGASRRARPSHVVAAEAAESDGAGAAEEQIEKQGNADGCKEASTDDAPALGVGLRRCSRRAPAVIAPAAEEEQRAPIPRGRRVKAKPTELIRLDNSDDEEAANMKPEKEEDAPALGVGRRARAAPSVAEPTGKAEEEQRAPISRGCCVKSKQTELISLDDSEEEKENTKPEKEEDAPAIGVGRRGGSRRAPAHVEAPATRRTAATGKTEARDVVMEAVPVPATRQRKLTMKAAAAAAEDKAPRRVLRRGAVRKTLLQHEEQEETQGAVSVAEAVCAVSVEDLEHACDPQNEEPNEAVHASKEEDKDVAIIQDEVLMEENPVEEPLVTDQECIDRSTLQEHIVDVDKCPSPLASQDDSPILGLVSMSTGQAAGEEEGANFQDIGSCEGLLGKRMCEEVCDAVEEMEMIPVVQLLQETLKAEESTEDVIAAEASHKKEISEVGAEDDIVSPQKDDLVDEAIFLDYPGNISQVAGEETNEVHTEDGFRCQTKGDVAADNVLPDTVDEVIILEVEEAGNITCEVPESPAALDGAAALDVDGEETTFCADKQSEVVIGDSVSQITMIDVKVVQEEKVGLITDELPLGIAALHDFEGDHSEAAFVHGDEVIMADNLPEVKMTDCEIVVEEKKPLIVGEKQDDTATVGAGAVDDHFKTDAVCANELMEVVTTEEVPELTGTDSDVDGLKTPLIVDEPQRTVAMDEDVVKDNLETDVVHADEQMEVVTIDEVPEFKRTDGEVVGEKKTPLTVYEKQQIMLTINGDVVDHLKNDVAHGDELKDVVTSELVEEKATVSTVDMPNITHTTDVCVKERHFGHDNEEKEAITSDIVPEVSRTEDRDALKDNAFTSHIPQEFVVAEDFNGHIAPSMLDDLTELKSIITVEPSVLTADDTSECKNSSEKNTTEPVAVQEDKGVKVVKKSVDLNVLSLGQLRAKLKKKLNAKKNKEAKRVALARVDENICRSHAKGQQQNLNLHQH